jgi:hypothetical protein
LYFTVDDVPTLGPTKLSFWDMFSSTFAGDPAPTAKPVQEDPRLTYEPGTLEAQDDKILQEEQEDREEDKEELEREGILPTEESDADIVAARDEEADEMDDTDASEVK